MQERAESGPIFVVGAPRTGTTLTREILNGHPEVYLCNEVHFCERVLDVMPSPQPSARAELARALSLVSTSYPWRMWTDEPSKTEDEILSAVERSGSGFAGLFRELLAREGQVHGAKRWGDSSPQDVLYVSTLLEWFPDACFVCLVRDPRAFLASYKNYYRKQIKTYHHRYDPLANTLLWRSYNNAIVKARERAPGAVHLLRYEDLVLEPESSVRELCHHLGLEYSAEMLAVTRQNSSYFHVREDFQAAGISNASVSRWRSELKEGEVWLVERLTGRLMQRFDYEPVGQPLTLGAVGTLLAALARMPRRVFNLLFRTGKPFTLGKLRRAIGGIRGG